jgi:hypothetical protein
MAKKLVIRHIRNSTLAGKSAEFESTAGGVKIGRRDDVQVKFDAARDPLVSGHHAQVSVDGDAAFVEDLGSSNGTFVNGTRINARTRVGNHDRITLGQNGPEFVVTVFDPAAAIGATVAAPPRPAAAPPAMPASGPAGTVAVTAPAASPPRPPSLASQGKMPQKSSIGMNTLMGVIAKERGSERKRTLTVVGLVAALLAITTGVAFWLFPKSVIKQEITKQETTIVQGGGVNWQDVFAKVSNKVYVVMKEIDHGNGKFSYQPMGTAWSAAKGILGTNSHVAVEFYSLEQGERLVCRPQGGKEKEVHIKDVKLHPGYLRFEEMMNSLRPIDGNGKFTAISAGDVACLYIADADLPKQAEPFQLLSDDEFKKMRPGEPAAIVGYPMEGVTGGGVNVDAPIPFQRGGSVTRISDAFAAPSDDPLKASLFAHDVSTRGGASGSPLINKDGKVIGLHCASDVLANSDNGRISVQGYSYAQNVRLLRGLIDGKQDADLAELEKLWRASLIAKVNQSIQDEGEFIGRNLMMLLNSFNRAQVDIEALKQTKADIHTLQKIESGKPFEFNVNFKQGFTYVCIWTTDPSVKDFKIECDDGRGYEVCNTSPIKGYSKEPGMAQSYYYADIWKYPNASRPKLRVSGTSADGKEFNIAVHVRFVPTKAAAPGQ